MGLFSTKKKIYVSSVVYNLAGSLAERTSFLKTTVVRGLMSSTSKTSLGAGLIAQQLNGPLSSQKSFFRWAKTHYPEGRLSGKISNYASVNADMVLRFIPVPAGKVANIQGAHIDSADATYWAEQYLMENHFERLEEDWVCDINTQTNLISIEYADGTSDTFMPADFHPSSAYIFANYTLGDKGSDGVLVQGDLITNVDALPDLTGYSVQSSKAYGELFEYKDKVRTLVTVEGSGSTSSTAFIDQSEVFSGVEQTHTLSEKYSPIPGEVRILEDVTTVWTRTRPKLVPTVTEQIQDDGAGTVTTVTTTTYEVVPAWDYRIDVLEGRTVATNLDVQKMFIYRIGSGNLALDSLRVDRYDEPEFYPIIPLRVDNVSVRDPSFEERFKLYDKAYSKAVGGDINDLIDSVEDNEQLGDIDYAFLVQGIELNTPEREGKRYLYEFFKGLIPQTIDQFENWRNEEKITQEELNAELEIWSKDQELIGPLWGTPKPIMRSRVVPQVTSLDIQTSAQSSLNFRFRINWLSIKEEFGIGQGKPGAANKELWWEVMPDIVQQGAPAYKDRTGEVYFPNSNAIPHVRLYWQTSADSFRYLDMFGLVHENFVYQNKSIEISSVEALEDTDDSGFVVPLHAPTMRRLPLKDANELGMISRQLMFNCYLVKKTKWYQTFIFKIILAAVLSVIFMPASIGILGANAAVGAAIGLSGITGLLAGAIANAIAAVMLTTLIQVGATAVFGEKLGAIIGAVATMFAFAYIGNFHTTGSWNFNWSEMLRVDNLLKLTDSVSGGIQNWAQAEMGELAEEGQEAQEDYSSTMKDIEKMTEELVGYSGVDLDPLMRMQMQGNSFGLESSSTFLSRTLMTGSEIADVSFSMIESFAELSLKLPKLHD